MSIKIVNRNTDYAVRALCYMAKKEGNKAPARATSVTELVKELDIPRPFLRKILQELNGKRLLISQKGSGGGFILSRRPEEISLLDVMEAFQGPVKLNECVLQKEVCPNRKKCVLRKKLGAIEQFIRIQLKPVTIKELAYGDKDVLQAM